jgi:hypothetical protein
MRHYPGAACTFLLLSVFLALLAPNFTRAAAAPPLSEKSLVKLIELEIDDDTIAAKLKGAGVGFAVDDAVTARLKKAGASDHLLEAVCQAGARTPASTGKVITYNDVLKLLQVGLDEKDVLKRLEKSPTWFVLDSSQVAELKKAGATDLLLAAITQGPPSGTETIGGPKITDYAIVLDCSGSMSEQTSDGSVKMDAAKRVIADLVANMPETLRVSLVVFGHDKEQNCHAVKVARALGPLGPTGKAPLIEQIKVLKPMGTTPIAQALEAAGRELAKADANCRLVLLTDGKETCGGDPADVASRLAGRLKLHFGVNVIGFDVQSDERASLVEIARAGKGNYYNAQSAAELTEIFRGLQNEIQVVARPAAAGDRIVLNAEKIVRVQPAAIQLPPLDVVYLAPAGAGALSLRVDHYAKTPALGKNMRVPPSVKAESFDLWWVPREGRAVKMIKDLTLDEPVTIVKPEEHLGLVRVTGRDLPAADLILLTPIGTASFAIRAESSQSTFKYGKDMVVAPGRYDLWIEPTGGGNAKRLAEKIDVAAGKLTLID